MKKILIVVCLVFIITGFAAAQEFGQNATLYVSVNNVDMVSSTGDKVAKLSYGDKVTVIKVVGKNVEVKSVADPSKIGLVPSAKLTTKKIVVGSSSTTSAKEVALAGKGFNQDVENTYSTQGQVNFDDVDKIEAITADDNALMRFIEEGHLSPGR